MLGYTFYDFDNRVMRYADTLAQEGHSVDVIVLKQPQQSFITSENLVRIIRIQKRSGTERSKFSYLLKLTLFLLKATVLLSILQIRKRYDIIHVHNVPDFLVFAALIPKLTGSKIILDIHDILPEFYASKFKSNQKSLAFRALVLLERWSAKFADRVVLSNHLWYSRYTSRSAGPEKCSVILNFPNPALFFPRRGRDQKSGFTFIYPGTLNWHQGLDIAIKAFAILAKKTDSCRFDILGVGPSKYDLQALITSLGLEGRVQIRDSVPLTNLPEVVASADCGVVPKRAEGFGGEAFSTKILEFMAMGIPVIAAATPIDRYYFDDSLLLFFGSGDEHDLASKMEEMVGNAQLRTRLSEQGLAYSRRNCWTEKRKIYLELIEALLPQARAEQQKPEFTVSDISRAVTAHFKCPEDMMRMEVAGELSEKPGFFQFGDSGATCFARCSAISPTAQITKEVPDVSHHIQSDGGIIKLPFNPSEAIEAIRCERYMRSEDVAAKSFSFGPIARTAYYAVRPFLPVSVRRHLQRLSLRDWNKRAFPRWPLDTSVEQIMENLVKLTLKSRGLDRLPFIWFWPDGALAAAVVTHDVETAAGRDFCPQLMDIDDNYGIKASFQVVPEERYAVPESYLGEIRRRGFEVDVQDLNHDGLLFKDFAEFKRRAKAINQHGAAFQARGFRSAVLYRNPDWLNLLDFEYDMSTPNVAHLDPQRGGCCTVFPYFIGNVLEIPVTTTQDYSLLYILRKYSLDLWETQIAMILDRHGLMSFIIHPDYITKKREQRVYRELLEHLSELRKTAGLWVTLPGDVNDWWRQRSRMKLVESGDGWEILGEGRERARIAFASLEDDELVYRIGDRGAGVASA
ncbi:MAG: glycosyltransferase [Terriglobia bacterium]|jgi:glycosyltransferase involved in cell wall biosynthesis